MKRICSIIFLLFSIISCKKNADETIVQKIPPIPASATQQPAEVVDVNKWDFNGDGKADDEITVPVVEGTGNPVEDGTPGKFTITFDNKTLPNLAVGCCNPMPVGEGDLNGDGAAELSVFQSPMNGCVYTMTTYTFRNGKWRQLFEPFLVPTGCDEIRTEDLEKLVYRKNGKVYIMETDVNDEDFKKNPKEVKL